MGGLKGQDRTPAASTRVRRNATKLASQFSRVIGDGLQLTDEGLIAVYYGPLQENVLWGIGIADNLVESSGNYNTALGSGCLAAITTGDGNVCVGNRSGEAITTGSFNMAIGTEALAAVISSDSNTGIGKQAGRDVTTGRANICIGEAAGRKITTGQNNTFIGPSAGFGAGTDSSGNVCIGWTAGYGVSPNAYDEVVFIGTAAGLSVTTGDRTVGIGTEAFRSITTGKDNVGIGYRAGHDLTTGEGNVYVGRHAGYEGTTQNGNICLGQYAGKYNILADRFIVDDRDRTDSATEITNALLYGIMAATPAGQSLAINGDVTITGNVDIGTGKAYTINGINALNLTATDSVAIGDNALRDITTGVLNVGIGTEALLLVTTGGTNVAIGPEAMSRADINASQNVCLGYRAGRRLAGNKNFALGRQTMGGSSVPTTGGRNIGIGYNSLFNLIAGGNNVAIGTNTGYLIEGGSGNILLGDQSGSKQVNASNLLIIDNLSRADVATEASNAILYGVMAAAPANQSLAINVGTLTNSTGTFDFDNENLTTTGTLTAGASTFGDGGTTNYAQFEADGTLEFNGAAIVWDDLRVSVNSVKVPATKAPAWTTFSAGLLLGFSHQSVEANEEEVYFVVQIPHGRKLGSNIIPHLHWVPNEDTTDDPEVVRWGLEYEWVDTGNNFSATTTIYAEESFTDTANKHTYTTFAAIDGSGHTALFTMLVCRLFRNSSHANDTYDSGTALALLLEIDFHIEINTIGSRQESTK